MGKGKKKELVVGVCGSIAAFKAAELVSRLARKNFEVTVVMTEGAQKFIRPLTFWSLSRQPVITDLFPPEGISQDNHIVLARRVSLVIIAPASADIIGKMAQGIADDFLTTLVIALSCPVLVCPAMHQKMYANSFVQENIGKLKKAGFYFLGPESGRLSSGDKGKGRLVSVDRILSEALKILRRPAKRR